MADPIKFTEQEVKDLRDLQTQYQQVTYSLGQIQIEKRLLESKENEINVIYDSLSKKEKELLESLNTKYGSGTLNLENGTFTPTN